MEVEVGVDKVVDEVASAVDGEADAGETEVEAGKLDAVVVDDEVLGVEEVVDDEGAEASFVFSISKLTVRQTPPAHFPAFPLGDRKIQKLWLGDLGSLDESEVAFDSIAMMEQTGTELAFSIGKSKVPSLRLDSRGTWVETVLLLLMHFKSRFRLMKSCCSHNFSNQVL